jgi:hypothetical protein
MQPENNDPLGDKRYTTVICRLLLDEDGRLLQGHLVDTLGRPLGGFRGENGLNQALQTWLAGQRRIRGIDPLPDMG